MNRLTNMLLASIAFIALLPVMLLIGLGVRVVIGKPILFEQDRPGLNGKAFRLFKFRTMRNATDESGDSLPDADRLTPFGRFLRRTSLDELPELWNVIVGDMNLVGPRPLLKEYLPLYTKEQYRRHEVLPGITGWAQVNGRNRLDWEERLKLDTWYVVHRSFWLDLKILGLTTLAVFRTHEVSQEGHATSEKFQGREE
ncbi:MAG: sugar transferase [Sedimenticolaceae bacterium]